MTCERFKKGKKPLESGNCETDYELGDYYGEKCCIHKDVCKNPPNKDGLCDKEGYPRLFNKYNAINCCGTEKKGATKTSYPTKYAKSIKLVIAKRGRPPNVLSKKRGRPPKSASKPTGV